MENLLYGLEMLVIGFVVVMVTLLLLALILICFNKIFTTRKKANKANNEVRKAEDRVAATISTSENANDVKPEVIAATMGALLFAFDTGAQAFKNPVITKINAIEQQGNMWAQVGRTRLLHLRQDFALLRRGKNR